ncbi:sodium:calcium antiporter [Patescibacteria group bacterium]|nr:sodium:calcium antiporter [Patescibacteria group bacterium]
MALFNIFLIAIASFILIKAVSLFIKSTTNISRALRVSGYTISFLLVSVATSLPETIVGINSALAGKPILSYGNALGSNIALLTLIIAIPGFINSGLHTRKIFRSKDIYISSFFAILAVALALDGQVTRFDGYTLLVGYVIYSISFLRRNSHIHTFFHGYGRVNLLKESLIFIMSLCLIIISGELVVRGAINLADVLKISLGFVGLSIMAIGTSLPEIAYSIGLIKKHKQNEVLGNVIGSVGVNSTLVLGITAVIEPIVIVNGGISITTYIFAIMVVALFLGFSKKDHDINKKEATVLLLVYIAFLTVEYLVQ